ncbi:MAG: hypothetical protein H6709_07955 [Kofleriaceae bacterium]|nr:hypothetical protein [Myxococcales bacterium]MCB9572010.1 hypothetical protein [Kofleriaceae bacterium]
MPPQDDDHPTGAHALGLDPHEDETSDLAAESDRKVFLSGGRTITVGAEAGDEILELRNPSGMLELRIRLTEDGPVLQVEGVKVAVKAAESVEVDCKRFEVRATESVTLASEGEVDVTSEKEMRIKATDDLHVLGKIIHLN